MVCDTLPSQDASKLQIWNSYLKEYRRYAPDTKRDRRTVRLLYASQSSFGGIKSSSWFQTCPNYNYSTILKKKYLKTRNVSMGQGCPRSCQIRINRALSIIELDLYFMIINLCMKYESNTPMYSKDITQKPFFIRRSRAITLIIIGGFYP